MIAANDKSLTDADHDDTAIEGCLVAAPRGIARRSRSCTIAAAHGCWRACSRSCGAATWPRTRCRRSWCASGTGRTSTTATADVRWPGSSRSRATTRSTSCAAGARSSRSTTRWPRACRTPGRRNGRSDRIARHALRARALPRAIDGRAAALRRARVFARLFARTDRERAREPARHRQELGTARSRLAARVPRVMRYPGPRTARPDRREYVVGTLRGRARVALRSGDAVERDGATLRPGMGGAAAAAEPRARAGRAAVFDLARRGSRLDRDAGGRGGAGARALRLPVRDRRDDCARGGRPRLAARDAPGRAGRDRRAGTGRTAGDLERRDVPRSRAHPDRRRGRRPGAAWKELRALGAAGGSLACIARPDAVAERNAATRRARSSRHSRRASRSPSVSSRRAARRPARRPGRCCTSAQSRPRRRVPSSA